MIYLKNITKNMNKYIKNKIKYKKIKRQKLTFYKILFQITFEKILKRLEKY